MLSAPQTAEAGRKKLPPDCGKVLLLKLKSAILPISLILRPVRPLKRLRVFRRLFKVYHYNCFQVKHIIQKGVNS